MAEKPQLTANNHLLPVGELDPETFEHLTACLLEYLKKKMPKIYN
jgi:hypothetical protein